MAHTLNGKMADALIAHYLKGRCTAIEAIRLMDDMVKFQRVRAEAFGKMVDILWVLLRLNEGKS